MTGSSQQGGTDSITMDVCVSWSLLQFSDQNVTDRIKIVTVEYQTRLFQELGSFVFSLVEV